MGAAIAKRLAADGYRVWVHYRSSADSANAVVEQLGDCALGPVAADLATDDGRDRLAQAVTDPQGNAGGRLDLLVNSAASFEHGDFAERNDADLRRVLEMNLVAPVGLARRLAPALRRADGAIVNIVDVAAYHPWGDYFDHCTAKAGLRAATEGLAIELAPLRVNGVAPGTVMWPEGPQWDPGTEQGRATRERMLARIPRGTIGSPEDIAQAVAFLARAPYISGQVLPVDGGRLAGIGQGHETEPHGADSVKSDG